MAYTLFTVQLRNAEAVRTLTNALNQGQTVTYTFTVNDGSSFDDGVIGTLAATVASTFWPPNLMPVGTQPNITPDTVSN